MSYSDHIWTVVAEEYLDVLSSALGMEAPAEVMGQVI